MTLFLFHKKVLFPSSIESELCCCLTFSRDFPIILNNAIRTFLSFQECENIEKILQELSSRAFKKIPSGGPKREVNHKSGHISEYE